jgi:hypothetical protein
MYAEGKYFAMSMCSGRVRINKSLRVSPIHRLFANENIGNLLYCSEFKHSEHKQAVQLSNTPAGCQGFTKSHSSPGPNGLQPKGLKEYLDNYLISDYLGPILGSKWLIMQTIGNYLGLSWTWTFRGSLRKDVSGCHPDF